MKNRKFQFNDYEEDVVRLSQYIFLDTDLGETHAIFNFDNNFTESIKSIDFVVIQYDEEDQILNKTKLHYDGFEAKGNTSFVPKVKLLIEAYCERLDVYVEEATFDDFYLIDGVVHEITKDEELESEDVDTSIEHYFDATTISYAASNKLILLTSVAVASITAVVLYLVLPYIQI